MRVGVIQSSYIPWRGYFDFIASVDLFVFYDDVQFSMGNWRNRNMVKTRNGLKWLTVPVQVKAGSLPIDQVRIGHTLKPWQEAHRNLLRESLAPAQYGNVALELWEEGIAAQDLHISKLNIRLTKIICNYLRIATPFAMARDLTTTGTKTSRLISLLRQVGATIYVSGPTAKGYLEEESFREHGIRLEYKSYLYPPYPQLWGDFEGAVSVLDLIGNCGPEAGDFLKSVTPNEIAVP